MLSKIGKNNVGKMHSKRQLTNAGSVKSGTSLIVNETNIQTLDRVNTINAIQFGCNANSL